jgi:methylated-DNA-[protein]-cysteine S-methyltransferase
MHHIQRLYFTTIESPGGHLLLTGIPGALRSIRFFEEPESGWIEEPSLFREAARQLDEYFDGRRKAFNLPLDPQGTPFQKQVWEQLHRIPYGQTISYKTLAERIGNPSAVRAVGAANGANPLPIVVPCHRVIGADGSLVGFGGGLPLKKYLLELENPARRLF